MSDEVLQQKVLSYLQVYWLNANSDENVNTLENSSR